VRHADGAVVRRSRRTRVVALLGSVMLASAGLLALGAVPAASEAEAPKAYSYQLSDITHRCQLVQVDLDTGIVDHIGPHFDESTDGCPFDLAVKPSDDGQIDKLYAVVDPCQPGIPCVPPSAPAKGTVPATDSVSSQAAGLDSVLISIDPENGKRTTIGHLGFGSGFGGLAFGDDGTLWYFAVNNDPACTSHECLYRINPSTAAVTLAGDPTFTSVIFWGMEGTCDHVFANAFTLAPPAPNDALNEVHTPSGVFTPRPRDYGADVVMTALGRDSDGELWGVGYHPIPGPDLFADVVYKIDDDTGKATAVTDNLRINHQADRLFGLEIAPLSCDPHPDDSTTTTTTPPVVVSEPTFTG
jgi:hypothetical protein